MIKCAAFGLWYDSEKNLLGKRENMSNKLIKLENAERVEELSPETTLRTVGLRADDVFCDIGAGSGLFALTAAKNDKRATYMLWK